MTQVLQWNGAGSLAWVEPPSTPDAGHVLLHAAHTLLELYPEARALASTGTVRETGAGVVLKRGARIVAPAPAPSSILTVPAQSCFVLEDAANPTSDSLIPPLAEVLCALRRAGADLGSNAVVAGSDLRAELLLHLLTRAGARSVASIRADDAPEPVARIEPVFRGLPAQYQSALTEYLKQSRGPVFALDTTSRGGIIQSLLASMPSRSSVVLLGGRGSSPTSVNFYRDVHSKNLRLFGSSHRSVSAADLERASRLLEEKRIDLGLFHFETVVPAAGRLQGPKRLRWALLEWGASSS